MGGDHSLSLPLLRAIAKKHGPVALIQFDAHNDLWDEYFGSKYSHGTPFRRAIEEGLIRWRAVSCRWACAGRCTANTISISRGSTKGENDHGRGISRGGIGDCFASTCVHFASKPVYITLDIDCVDPAYAPGTGTPQVGGFTSMQILELVRALPRT